jgi:hypothetical protein
MKPVTNRELNKISRRIDQISRLIDKTDNDFLLDQYDQELVSIKEKLIKSCRLARIRESGLVLVRGSK